MEFIEHEAVLAYETLSEMTIHDCCHPLCKFTSDDVINSVYRASAFDMFNYISSCFHAQGVIPGNIWGVSAQIAPSIKE